MASASLSLGNATSSIRTAVPGTLIPPTAGKIPLRIYHSFSYSYFTSVKVIGNTVGILAKRSFTASIKVLKPSLVSERTSTSRAVACSSRVFR